MSALRAVVVRPGRAAFGEIRRTQTWIRLFRAAGAEASDVKFLNLKSIRVRPTDAVRLRKAEIVPEAMVWSGARVRQELEELKPDVVIMQTARSYRRELLDGPWVSILDLVDRLSVSYRQRAAFASGRAKRSLLSGLATAHERFELEARVRFPNLVTAGWGDAAALHATWIPNLLDPTQRPERGREKPYDAVFFGSLGYAPNVEALRWLAEGEPTARAGLRVLVAGHAPAEEVRNLCESRGWDLVEDYPSNDWLAEQATISLAPLQSTAGIQNKVLEAAILGIPQVVTPSALAGVSEGFPAVVAETPAEFVAQARRLIDDVSGRDQLADNAWSYAHANYTVDRWLPMLYTLINHGDSVAPTWVTHPERGGS
ncbi:MAG: glycosyltransferase [Actinobacteria bacterium]|nr:glycosyltransferase [Actinomycetota bacterium]